MPFVLAVLFLFVLVLVLALVLVPISFMAAVTLPASVLWFPACGCEMPVPPALLGVIFPVIGHVVIARPRLDPMPAGPYVAATVPGPISGSPDISWAGLRRALNAGGRRRVAYADVNVNLSPRRGGAEDYQCAQQCGQHIQPEHVPRRLGGIGIELRALREASVGQ